MTEANVMDPRTTAEEMVEFQSGVRGMVSLRYTLHKCHTRAHLRALR